jgi:hypothetical protein
VRLSGVQHPPIVFKALRRPARIGHHAEDVIEFEHGQERIYNAASRHGRL